MDQLLQMVGGADGATKLLSGLVGGGGLNGLLSQFQAAGAGEQAKSWVSTGENQPISADQVTQALGQDQINQAAQQAGVSPEELSTQLAEAIPQTVDKLTPNGEVPDDAQVQEGLGKLIGG